MKAADSPVEGVESSPVYAAYLRELEALGEAHSALGQGLLMLARQLDAGAGMVAAAIHKEMRATLKELTPNDGGDPFAAFMASLPTAVRDAPQA